MSEGPMVISPFATYRGGGREVFHFFPGGACIHKRVSLGDTNGH